MRNPDLSRTVLSSVAEGWSCPQGGSLGEGADLATLPAVSLGGPALGLKLVSPPHQKCGVPWSLLGALSDTSRLQQLQLQICPPPASPLSQAAEGVSRDCSVGEFWTGPSASWIQKLRHGVWLSRLCILGYFDGCGRFSTLAPDLQGDSEIHRERHFPKSLLT